MGSEGQIYICCENAEGKENFTCLKTSNETSINLILTSSTLKHVWNYETEDKTECLTECLLRAKANDLVKELVHDHVTVPTHRPLDSANDRRA